MATIRVALAEDNVLLREGVSRLVSAHPDFELVGTASDLPELLDVIERCEPDVVITDIRMPPTGRDEGIQAAAWLREHRPQVGVVVLSQYTAPGYAVALLEHGSAGRAHLLKERVASLDGPVRRLHAGARSWPGGGGPSWPGPAPTPARPAGTRSPRGRRRSCPRWRRARTTPPSPRRSRCPSGRWRSTPTRSSPSWG